MKRPFASFHLVLSATALLLMGLPARAVTFTTNTAISFNDTNYDGLVNGQDITNFLSAFHNGTVLGGYTEVL